METEHPNENEDLAFNITSNSGDGLQAGLATSSIT